MCRHHRQRERLSGKRTSYEGATRQLSAETIGYQPQHTAWRASFPWWIFWLIWPAALLIKALAPFALSLLASVSSLWVLLALPLQVVGAAALMLVGVWLLRGRAGE